MQTKLLAEEKLAHRHDAILNILSRDYTSVYYVDIIKNKAIPYRVSGVMFELMGIEVEKPFVFETVFCNYVNSFVVEEDREEMLSYCDAVVLDELLKENGMFSHIYRVNRDGQIIYAQLRIAKVREERGLKFKIEVDGGVTLNNAAQIANVGADILVAGSAVFGADDIVNRTQDFKKL